jgi:hypothetical protein
LLPLVPELVISLAAGYNARREYFSFDVHSLLNNLIKIKGRCALANYDSIRIAVQKRFLHWPVTMWQLHILVFISLFLFHDLVFSFPWAQRHRDFQYDYRNVLHPKRSNNLKKRFSDTYTLWVTHYDGTLYTLNFNFNLNGTSTIDVVQKLSSCGPMPSWLGWGGSTLNTLYVYCLDGTYQDAAGNPANGSMNVYTVTPDDGEEGSEGTLNEPFSFDTLPGPVAAQIYSESYGSKGANDYYMAIAH